MVNPVSRSPARKRCVEAEVSSQERRAIDDGLAAARQAPGPGTSTKPTRVSVVVHVVSTASGTNVPVSNALVGKQLKVLNGDYGPAGFEFELKSLERNTVAKLPANDRELDAMKAKLHKGDARTLNLYVMPSLVLQKEGALLGIAAFPWDLAKKPGADGVTILASTMPCGSTDRYSNGGRTATHEIGHWLGLWHTFQGGCADSDHVIDTPAMAGPPVEQRPDPSTDTCPRKPGHDPVHNPMNYVADDWVEGFTPLQVKRMHQSWDKYRAP